jgi:hypothetical protein
MAVSIEETGIKLAIAEAYSNYATGLDTKNWALVRDCFCDQVLIDYGSISEPTGGPDVPRKADDWLEHLKGTLTGFDMTQHSITNHRYQFKGDTVQCTAYLVAEHLMFDDPAMPLANGDQFITVAGFYTNDYVQDNGQWRIAKSMLAVTWMRGDVGLFEKAALRAAG